MDYTFVEHKAARLRIMAAILANCRGYKIEDKVDGTVLEQVETVLNCSLVICDYGKYTNYMILRLLSDKKENKTRGKYG